MTNPQDKHDPHAGEAKKAEKADPAHNPQADPRNHPTQADQTQGGPARYGADDVDDSRPEQRAHASRKGHGPDNPLPGEVGGPTTSGYSEADRREAEEGQRKAAEDKDREQRDKHAKR